MGTKSFWQEKYLLFEERRGGKGREGSKNKHNAMSQKFSQPCNSKLIGNQQPKIFPRTLWDTEEPEGCPPHDLASAQVMSAQLARPGSAIMPAFHLPESNHVSPQNQPDAVSDSGPAQSGLADHKRDSQCQQTSLAGTCWAGFPCQSAPQAQGDLCEAGPLLSEFCATGAVWNRTSNRH